ncbi:MAG: GAF domain-containing protein [Chloroflexi bacterium]|nr:GAF domain-containing protein [Chloroflexota bacterium]
MANVALGVILILLLFGVVALWTIRESTEAAYRERVMLAKVLVGRVDDALRYALATLERGAPAVKVDPGRPLTSVQRRQLAELRLELGSFAIVTLADASGNTLWTDPSRFDVVIGTPLGHPSVQAALRSGQSQVRQFRPPGNAEKAYACLAAPLKDASGQIVGALMAELDPSHPAFNLLPSVPPGDGLRVQLVDAEGQLLAGDQGYGSAASRDHQELLAELIAGHRAGYRIHEATLAAEWDSHMVAYASSSMLPSWGIVLEQPRDVVVAGPLQLQQRLGLFGLAALLLAAAVAWFDVRRVVRPLRNLTVAAELFAAGKLDEPVRLERTDELGILAGAFETMRQRLQASMAEVAEWNRELERRVATRTAELERRNRELADLNVIAATLSGSLEVQEMLERTLERVIGIAGAELGCFWVAETEGSPLKLAAASGFASATRGASLCGERCPCAAAAASGQPIVTEGAAHGVASLACRAAGVRSSVALPLLTGEQVQGVLYLGSMRADHFRQQELSTLAAIGQQVGMALANARLYQSLRARERERAELLQRVMDAQEEERRRLAQELHDETSQALASLRLGLERLASTRPGSDAATYLARQLQGVAAETLAAVHHLAVELRPSVLDDLGLVAAIQRYVQECAQRSNLAIDFAAAGLEHFRLMPAAETAIYRVVQAALTNVVQHAHAQRVSVSLQRRDGRLVVVVEDDGQGFELATVRAAPLDARLGLAGMQERAALIGASLTVETAPSAGTTVYLEVPVGRNGRVEEIHDQVAHRTG